MFAVRNDPAMELVTTTFTGPVAIDERCESLEATITQVHATGATKLLVDFSRARLLIEALPAARRLADHLLHYHHILGTLRIAYVMPDNKFDAALEVMARGRGLIAERFGSTGEALVWLLDDVGPIGRPPRKRTFHAQGPIRPH